MLDLSTILALENTAMNDLVDNLARRMICKEMEALDDR